MTDEKKKLVSSLIIPSGFIILIWGIKLAEIIFNTDFIELGLFPRDLRGLIGILMFPLIHSNINHLLSNSLPILILSTGIMYFYKNAAPKVFMLVYFLTGILLWFWGRSSYHIGASGLIYGFVTFLFFSGVIRRDTRSIALALLVTFLYGGLIWGILPLERGVSWEGHLFGAFSGLLAAILFRKSDPYKRYDWEDEPEDESGSKLEISYKNNPPYS